jgi:dCMP deaminase
LRRRDGPASARPLEAFVAADDALCYGPEHTRPEALASLSLTEGRAVGDGVRAAMVLADVTVANAADGLDALATHVDALRLLDPERVRPGWDHYFMVMAGLAARRSNCMKRRVGAVLVRDQRVIATGYNGTARSALRAAP